MWNLNLREHTKIIVLIVCSIIVLVGVVLSQSLAAEKFDKNENFAILSEELTNLDCNSSLTDVTDNNECEKEEFLNANWSTITNVEATKSASLNNYKNCINDESFMYDNELFDDGTFYTIQNHINWDKKVIHAGRVINNQNNAVNSLRSTKKNLESEFYAVFDSKSNVLNFYYDEKKSSHKGSTKTIYDNLPVSATQASSWGYDSIRDKIASIVIDSTVESYKNLTSTAYMFSNMEEASDIKGCEYLDLSNVTNMEYMFYKYAYNSTIIKSVPDVSSWDTSNVINMGAVFEDYAKSSTTITSVPDVSSWDTSSATKMYSMFYGYAYSSTSIEAVPNVTNWNTSSVKNMSNMFYLYAANTSNILEPLNLLNWDISSVTNVQSMFSYYSYHNEKRIRPIIYATDWNTIKHDGVIGYDMFSGSSLKGNIKGGYSSANTGATGCFTGSTEFYAVLNTAEVPNTANTLTFHYDENIATHREKTKIVYSNLSMSAWEYNSTGSSINNVTIDGSVANYAGLTNMQSMFSNLSNINTIAGLEYLNTSNVTNMSNIFCNCSSLTNLNLSNFNTSKVTNMSFMFDKCSNLENLDVSNFNTSSVVSMLDIFADCHKLTNLNVASWDTSKVTNMQSMFCGCSGLTNLDLSNWNTQDASSMSNMFFECSGLTTLNVSNWNTSQVTTMSSMFENCSALTNVDVSKFNTSNVTSLGSMFSNCSSLTSLNISAWNTSEVTGMSYLFNGCSSLANLDISGWDTSKVAYMSYMFFDCSSLSVLNISNFNVANVKEMSYMFHNCSSLTELDLSKLDPEIVTETICMFYGCSGLIKLDISKFKLSKVQKAWGMFDSCSNLTNIYCSNNWAKLSNIFSSENMFYGCVKLPHFDPNIKDKTYAYPDDGTNGYFSYKSSF